ncbi:putative P-loop containing nucleoside triphosphate hydrolase, leucine-rich repeat domain, L [Rosa chinensis]|uniref:Putative P-loop containing nucleoside triphosphate hydrolase, leucine-rich repeat domain, L n=1 Tax=Rosa chinensis TaxID=74649 RepID=A0A2P6PLU5_ROSCH|nr:putative disease resistance RPP13-like protein 1 [Rosa chinensis]PRQ22889.1 putative P-loop containing nucleoside triphosphate hydrolase, leucine-rich repeat domain, L [Rosa chinensis]
MALPAVVTTALELTGGGFISSALQPPFQKLANYIFSRIERTKDTGDKLRKLERTLLKIQSLIDQLEGKHSTSKACRLLIEDFKGVLLDSDDFLNEICHQLPKDGPSSLGILTRDKVGLTVKDVTDFFNELEGYFISEVTKPGPPQVPRGSSSFIDPSSVIGLEEKKKNIKLLLAADDKNTTVISIVGMAGIGKTTLVQLVCNDPEVIGWFNERIWWVCVSWEYDLIQITKSILEAATSSVCTLSNLDSIIRQLKKVMMERGRFLLVLDDMWNESLSHWRELKLLFSSAAPGSRVLVTTQRKTVSSIVTTDGDLGCFPLTTLTKEDCWEIIKKNLKTEVHNREDLKAIGLELAEKCKGLPLAAKVIGDALHLKSEEVEWDALLKCPPWDWRHLPEGENQVYRVLKPSYVHLPAYLTRCFVYFSIIPQSQKVKVEDLIQIWAAEGFTGAQGARRIEDIGMEYLKELCSRSFIQILSGEIKMNDFIHDLATSVSTNLCLRLEDTMSARSTSFLSQNVRYLSLLCQSDESDVCTAKLKELYRYQKLRTFMFFSHVNQLATNLSMSDIFQKFFEIFKWLRVLKLTGSRIHKLSGPIGKLKRLRYLDLSDTKIAKLPQEIVNLLALETLRLQKCTELKEWPKNFEKLVKLRHLHFDRQCQMCSMPKNFGKLTSLENLTTVEVESEKGYGIEELQNMNCLRGSIEIKNLENVLDAKNAEDAMLGKKQYLHRVKLQWDETRDQILEKNLFHQRVMSGLEPHYRLKELEVKGYCGSILSNWIDNPPSANAPTRQIEKLVLSSCPQLRKLSSICHLTSLKTLEILDCPKLNSLPERGLPSSLVTLNISESGISRRQCEDGGSMRETVRFILDVHINGHKIPTERLPRL